MSDPKSRLQRGEAGVWGAQGRTNTLGGLRGQALITSAKGAAARISHLKTGALFVSDCAGELIIQSKIISVRTGV